MFFIIEGLKYQINMETYCKQLLISFLISVNIRGLNKIY